MREPIKKDEVWINFKHRKPYIIVGQASESTNERAGLIVVVYKDENGTLYVREISEFYQKFYKEGTL